MNIIYEADSRRLMEKADKQIQRAVGHAVQLDLGGAQIRPDSEQQPKYGVDALLS